MPIVVAKDGYVYTCNISPDYILWKKHPIEKWKLCMKIFPG